mgnify:CR=1 FL=1
MTQNRPHYNPIAHLPEKERSATLFALYRKTAETRNKDNPKILKRTGPDLPRVSLSNGGAVVEVVRQISEVELERTGFNQGDYAGYARSHLDLENNVAFNNLGTIKPYNGYAQITGLLWVSVDDVIEMLWNSIPAEHRISVLDHLATDAMNAGHDNLVVSAILDDGAHAQTDFERLFHETHSDLVNLSAAIQENLSKSQAGEYATGRQATGLGQPGLRDSVNRPMPSISDGCIRETYRAAAKAVHQAKNQVIDDAADVSLTDEGGAYIAMRIWVDADHVDDGDYSAYAVNRLHREGATEFGRPPIVEATAEGAWLKCRQWLSDEDVLSHLHSNVAAKDWVSSLDNLATAFDEAGFDNAAIDAILDEGEYGFDAFVRLFDETGVSIGAFDVMLSEAVRDKQSGRISDGRPKG